MKKKTIAIWAPLRYANYGDDLQAIVCAQYLKDLGYDIKLFQLEETLSKEYDLRSVSTVKELCSDVNLCIIAGGALLTPLFFHKRILHKNYHEYERDFLDLNNAVKRFNTKYCAISMGGDGNIHNPFIYYSRHRRHFFKSKNFLDGTVRLEGDVDQMKVFGKNFKYLPDILLQSPQFLKLKIDETLPPERPIRIGLNFKRGKYLDKKLLSDIFYYAENNDDIEFYFVKTHMDKTGINYEFTPDTEKKNIKVMPYISPSQLLEFMSGLDLLITSKLHLGITGLTIGTPYLSYRGPKKAKAFTESIGGEWAVVKNDISFKELLNEFIHVPKEELFSRYNLTLLDSMIDESKHQFSFCKEIVEKHG